MNFSFCYIINEERTRIARPLINDWVDCLEIKFLNDVIKSESQNRFQELESILNQLSLILFYVGEKKLSKQLWALLQIEKKFKII